MRVLMICGNTPGVRYFRFELPYAALKAKGINVEYYTLDELMPLDSWLYDNAQRFDVMHVGYLTDEAYVQLFIAARNYAHLPLITDIDDDILNVPEYSTAHAAYHGGSVERRVARMMLRVSDAVTVSTRPLRNVLANDCKITYVLPNCVNDADWPTLTPRAASPYITFMFAGNLARYGDLATVESVFKYAMDKYSQLRLYFMGCVPDWALQWMQSDTNPVANRAFVINASDPTLYREILMHLRPDVFFSPVACNRFNESKSHIKAYEAAFAGAAFLCTDWATCADVPIAGAVKVRGELEWREAVCQLVEDALLRERLAEHLLTWTLKQHIDQHIQKWVKCYEEVAARPCVEQLDDVVRPGVERG